MVRRGGLQSPQPSSKSTSGTSADFVECVKLMIMTYVYHQYFLWTDKYIRTSIMTLGIHNTHCISQYTQDYKLLPSKVYANMQMQQMSMRATYVRMYVHVYVYNIMYFMYHYYVCTYYLMLLQKFLCISINIINIMVQKLCIVSIIIVNMYLLLKYTYIRTCIICSTFIRTYICRNCTYTMYMHT